ncbi:MAG: porin family protein [Cyclobacteriaceae bacterium]
MKTTIFFGLLSFSVSNICFAQYEFGVNEVGIKVGPSLSNVSTDNVPSDFLNPSALMTFQAGVFGNFYLSERWSATNEILYSARGFRDQSKGSIERLHYLSIPLIMYYTATENLKVGVGIETNYLLAARSKVDGNNSKASSTYEHDCDIGFLIGTEYSLGDKFHVGGRYALGAANILGENHFTDEVGRASESVLQNRVLQFYVGYRLIRWQRRSR